MIGMSYLPGCREGQCFLCRC